MVPSGFHRCRPLAATVLAGLAISGCGRDAAGPAADRAASSGQPIGVVTETAQKQDFAFEIEALGTAKANEAVEVMSKVSNLVTAIRFREGEQVRRGAVLVELDSVEARAELAAARAGLSESQSQYQRSQELFATHALSQSQLEQLASTLSSSQARVTTAESRLADTVIRAPFDGRTGLRRVSVGTLVSAGTVITTLDDTRIIKLDFSIPEAYLAVLIEDLPLTARSVAYPDREFTGRVTTIDSRVDPTSRSIAVRAQLPNPDGLLKPGMFLTVRLSEKRSPALVIAEQALVPEEGRQFVFVVSDGRAEKRQITIGRRKPGLVEVTSGLNVGEVVIVEGTQKVRDGGPVRDLRDASATPAAS